MKTQKIDETINIMYFLMNNHFSVATGNIAH